MVDVSEACQQARPYLSGVVSGGAADLLCQDFQQEIQALVASGPCAGTPNASTLAVCLLGRERARLQSVLEGRGLRSADAIRNQPRLIDSFNDLLTDTGLDISSEQMAIRIRSGSFLRSEVLDVALYTFPHASPLATLYAALAQLGADGRIVLRTVLRYGPEQNAMAAAFALLTIDGDEEAARYLTAIAKAPMPPDASGLLYGRGIRAMAYLRRAGTQVDMLRLADIAVNAPLFTSADSPAPRMEAAKQRLAMAGGMRAAPSTYREELFREILLQARGVEALRMVIADRVHAEALLRAELGAGAEDPSLAATYAQIEAIARDATGDARARQQARALLQQLPPCP